MTKGRTTTKVSVRLPDDLLAELRKRADKAGQPLTMVVRHYLQEKCGMKRTA